MTLQSRRGHSGLAWITVATGIAACASPSPDVVATQQSPARDGGTLNNLAQVRPCRAGKYEGTFSSVTAGDAAQLSTLKGLISFELVQVPSGEFFRVSSGQKLEGSSAQGDTFSADIDSDSSGCREGVFNVKLQNGVYTVAQSQLSVPFDGSVDGAYLVTRVNGLRFEGFLGAWTSFWHFDPTNPTPIARGQWSATLAASP